MKKILILGAGLWQTPFIQKAKSMGLFVYATDWDSNPEGKVFANVFEQIDVRDKNKSLDFAQKHKVDAVFTNSDVGVPTAAYIAEKLSLPFHTQELADIATNKYLMRNALKKIGLKTPYYKQCSSLREIEDAVSTTDKKLIIKPIDNCGSRGVFVLSNTDNLKQIADNAFSNSFSGKVLIEELMLGTESSVEVIVNNGQPYILAWCKKQKSDYPYRYDIQLDYFPNRSEEENEQVSEMVSKLIDGLKIGNGILHIEFIWTEEGVKIIEFALRGCGSNVTTHLLPKLRGFDVMAFLIGKSLGDSNPKIEFCNNDFGVLKFIVPQSGKIKSISGLEQIAKLDYIQDFRLDLTANSIVDTIKDGRSRPGHYILTAPTEKELLARMQHVEKQLKIEYYA